MALSAGSKAPDFTLKSLGVDGINRDVTLSDNFGKKNTVLLFFPAAFTGVCTQEFCDVTGGLAGYTNMDATVYGISVDSPFAQAGWAKLNHIDVVLLSDFAKRVIRDYDVVLPDFAGLGAEAAQRAVFIVDKEGIVRYSQVTASPGDMPDFDAVQAALNGVAHAAV